MAQLRNVEGKRVPIVKNERFHSTGQCFASAVTRHRPLPGDHTNALSLDQDFLSEKVKSEAKMMMD